MLVGIVEGVFMLTLILYILRDSLLKNHCNSVTSLLHLWNIPSSHSIYVFFYVYVSVVC